MEVCIIVHELVLWSNSIFGCKHISWRQMTNCVLDFVLYFCWFNRLCVSYFIWCECGGCNRGRHNVVRCFLQFHFWWFLQFHFWWVSSDLICFNMLLTFLFWMIGKSVLQRMSRRFFGRDMAIFKFLKPSCPWSVWL